MGKHKPKLRTTKLKYHAYTRIGQIRGTIAIFKKDKENFCIIENRIEKDINDRYISLCSRINKVRGRWIDAKDICFSHIK